MTADSTFADTTLRTRHHDKESKGMKYNTCINETSILQKQAPRTNTQALPGAKDVIDIVKSIKLSYPKL